jgi:hypothetical protein
MGGVDGHTRLKAIIFNAFQLCNLVSRYSSPAPCFINEEIDNDNLSEVRE